MSEKPSASYLGQLVALRKAQSEGLSPAICSGKNTCECELLIRKFDFLVGTGVLDGPLNFNCNAKSKD